MDKFTESVTKRQIDNDTPCVRTMIRELVRAVGSGGMHRPVILHAELGNRVELLHIARQLTTERHAGRIRMRVEPSELTRTFEDTQPDGCFYVPGDVLPHALQRKVVAKYGDEVQRFFTPPIFVVIVDRHPDVLREQGVWRSDFRALFGERIVSVPTAAERKPPELVERFRNAVRRAVMNGNRKKFKIERGAFDLLTTEWVERPPPSLDYVIAAANKTVAMADERLESIVCDAAKRVASKRRLIITGKDVVNALMPDSPLADRAPRDAPIY